MATGHNVTAEELAATVGVQAYHFKEILSCLKYYGSTIFVAIGLLGS